MDLGGDPQVKTNGLHDPEGGARGEHVGRGEHPRVLLDHGGRGRVRARVEVSLDGGPSVLPVLHEERSWIDGVSAFLTLASISAMYCWCSVTSSRVPSLPRWPPMKCFH